MRVFRAGEITGELKVRDTTKTNAECAVHARVTLKKTTDQAVIGVRNGIFERPLRPPGMVDSEISFSIQLINE